MSIVGLIFDRDFPLSCATVRVFAIERAVQTHFARETAHTRGVVQAAWR